MNKLKFSILTIGLVFGGAALARDFTLLNLTDSVLTYDKQDQAGAVCGTKVQTHGSINPGQQVKFSVNTNWKKGCVWSFIGYKIMKNNNYIGYLSLNVSHSGGGPFDGFDYGATQTFGDKQYQQYFYTQNGCIGATCK